MLSYAYHTNWGIKWTSDSLGCSEWYQWDADVKLEAYFTVGVQSAFHSIQSLLEMILVRKCWQYYLHVPEDGHTDVTSLDVAFSSPTWQNVLIQVQIQDWLSKLAWKKIESHTWKSSSSQGLLSTAPWQGVRALGERRLQLSGKSPV